MGLICYRLDSSLFTKTGPLKFPAIARYLKAHLYRKKIFKLHVP